MCSDPVSPASTAASLKATGLEEGAVAFGRRKGPCTGKESAETASEDGVVNATSGSDGLGGEGAPLLCAESLPRGGGIAGAALYLGLVSSAKVEPGGADGDAGSNLEGAEVDLETVLAFGFVGRAGPEIEAPSAFTEASTRVAGGAAADVASAPEIAV